MNRLQTYCVRLAARIAPPLGKLLVTANGTVDRLADEIEFLRYLNDDRRRSLQRNAAEWAEALSLASGGGPWHPTGLTINEAGAIEPANQTGVVLKERLAELELALEDRGWKRQLAIAETEFSRYGLQQLILIARLYFIKNPLIRRGVLVSCHYVFGRGFEISSTDEAADEVLQDFLCDPRNISEIGQRALGVKEQVFHTDGNVFFVFFTSPDDGKTVIRSIDPIEIEEIVTDPDDHAVEWYLHRRWTRQVFDVQLGTLKPEPQDAWYVAHGYDPPKGVTEVHGRPIVTDPRTGEFLKVYHTKEGGLPKWHFGAPMVYAALDWARAYRHFLEDWATITRALARFAWSVETKGGPAAISAFKQTLATTLGNDGESIETNPPPVAGSAWISGPGNKLTPVKTAGSQTEPEQGRRVMLMVAAAFGLPETFFGDASTGSLATAQSLDRPTELKFLERQETWREILQTICKEVLERNKATPKGKLRESLRARKLDPAKVEIRMTPRRQPKETVIEIGEAAKKKRKATPNDEDTDRITIDVKFPSILEHDIDKRVSSIVEAMGLNGFETIGIDEKLGVGLLLAELGVENVQVVLDAMYPDDEYEPDRTIEEEPPAPPAAPGAPPQPTQNPAAQQGAPPQAPKPRTPHPKRVTPKEATITAAVLELRRALAKLKERGAA